MNGSPRVAYFSFWHGPGWLRLGGALAASCLAHAALVVLPGFGARPGEPASAPVLDVRLLAAESVSPREPSPAVRKEGPRAPPSAPVIAVRPLPSYHFYTADQLTSRARPLNRPRLDVPAGQDFASGVVVLGIWIDALGNVVAVEVEKSEVPQAVSAMAAATFRNLRYIPGEIDGRKVASLMRVEVTYLDGKRVFNILGAPR
jgi:hypothetical protein